jgi:hypothetical protein
LSNQDRSEFDWVKSSKLVRLGVYEAGILIGALLVAPQIDHAFGGVWPWPDYPLGKIVLLIGLALWISMVFRFNEDRKSIQRIDDLERDDLARERID